MGMAGEGAGGGFERGRGGACETCAGLDWVLGLGIRFDKPPFLGCVICGCGVEFLVGGMEPDGVAVVEHVCEFE